MQRILISLLILLPFQVWAIPKLKDIRGSTQLYRSGKKKSVQKPIYLKASDRISLLMDSSATIEDQSWQIEMRPGSQLTVVEPKKSKFEINYGHFRFFSTNVKKKIEVGLPFGMMKIGIGRLIVSQTKDIQGYQKSLMAIPGLKLEPIKNYRKSYVKIICLKGFAEIYLKGNKKIMIRTSESLTWRDGVLDSFPQTSMIGELQIIERKLGFRSPLPL